jgi:hypothetical protein
MAAETDRAEREPIYEPPKLTVHGTAASTTAAAHPGPGMDHHFPMNGKHVASH